MDIGMGLAQSGGPMDLFVGLILILTHYQLSWKSTAAGLPSKTCG